MTHYRSLCLFLSFMLLMIAGSFSAQAQDAPAVTVSELTDQLTMDDLQALNDNKAEVYLHNNRVTFVDGTCTAEPVNSLEDAAAVVASMTELLGGDALTRLDPWRVLTDASGNKYYVFQQMYANTSVLGGAVKVITDPEGNMIGLTSSIENDLPLIEESEGITMEQAEQLVMQHAVEIFDQELTLIEGSSSKMILPVFLSMTEIIEADEADFSRFVWVVYTTSPDSPLRKGLELPYLAHYVTMDGEYLYSLETIYPGDTAGESGFAASYVFEFMEPVDYTGYVDLSDGTEMELTVTVMRDTRTGMYYLGNIERQIVVADCYEFLYNNDRVVLASSPDNREWDQVGLLAFYNMCKAYDYYKEIGWIGGDGNGTPIMILNNIVDENRIPINNAAFFGNYLGWSIFGVAYVNDLTQALDVLAHEFTHCVTHSVMTYNSYMNDYGAINEAISDIHGQICDLMDGNTSDTDWVIGDKSSIQIRTMGNPYAGRQPAYSWDIYYKPAVRKPTAINDNGGVHSNSSLLNSVAYMLVNDGGMSLEEARAYWFAVDCAMVPGTDYIQLRELLPWMLKVLGMEQYGDSLQHAIDATRLGNDAMPDFFDADRALVTLTLPGNENFTDDNWSMQIVSVDIHGLIDRGHEIIEGLRTGDYSTFPPEVRDLLNRLTRTAEEKTPEPEKQGFLDRFIANLERKNKAKKEPAPEITDEEAELLVSWIQSEIRNLFYMGMGAAGQDGQTIRMVTKPGRTIPILMHMAFQGESQVPDQMVMAIYILDKWYVLDTAALSGVLSGETSTSDIEPSESPLAEDLVNHLMENLDKIKSLDDALDLFTTVIPGGDITEIPAAGLEIVVLPEPSELTESKETAPAELPEPPKKSRPKL